MEPITTSSYVSLLIGLCPYSMDIIWKETRSKRISQHLFKAVFGMSNEFGYSRCYIFSKSAVLKICAKTKSTNTYVANEPPLGELWAANLERDIEDITKEDIPILSTRSPALKKRFRRIKN